MTQVKRILGYAKLFAPSTSRQTHCSPHRFSLAPQVTRDIKSEIPNCQWLDLEFAEPGRQHPFYTCNRDYPFATSRAIAIWFDRDGHCLSQFRTDFC